MTWMQCVPFQWNVCPSKKTARDDNNKADCLSAKSFCLFILGNIECPCVCSLGIRMIKKLWMLCNSNVYSKHVSCFLNIKKVENPELTLFITTFSFIMSHLCRGYEVLCSSRNTLAITQRYVRFKRLHRQTSHLVLFTLAH